MNSENNLQQSIWGYFHLLQVLCFCSYSKILMNIANSYLFVIIRTEKGEEKKKIQNSLTKPSDIVLYNPGEVD